MKKFVSILCLVFLIFPLARCAQGPGNAEGNLGGADLFLSLVEPALSEGYVTASDWVLFPEETQLAIASLTFHNQFFDQSGEVENVLDLEGAQVDLLSFQDLPGVLYQGVTLNFATLPMETDHDHGEEASEETQDEVELDSEEHGEEALSFYFSGEARWGDFHCPVQIELNLEDGETELHLLEGPLEIVRDTTQSFQVFLDLNPVFEVLSLSDTCTQGEEQLITPEDPQAQLLVQQLTHAFSIEASNGAVVAEEESGHDHASHSH